MNWYSGWCGLRLPAESHTRCTGSFQHFTCACHCHEVLDLDDALRQLCRAVCGIGPALPADRHDPICTTVRRQLSRQETP